MDAALRAKSKSLWDTKAALHMRKVELLKQRWRLEDEVAAGGNNLYDGVSYADEDIMSCEEGAITETDVITRINCCEICRIQGKLQSTVLKG